MMSALQEILGAANFWLDQRGNAVAVRNHLEWACRHLRMPEPDPMDDRSQRRVLYAMFDRGFIRVAIDSSRVAIDYRQIRNAQLDWLREQADARNIPVKDDDGNEIYRPGAEESVASKVVSVLLEEHLRIA